MNASTPRGAGRSSRSKTTRLRRVRKEVEEALNKVSKLTIRRLARRGGVKRISEKMYPEIRELLGIYLENLIRGSVEFCEYHKRKTVTAADVLRTLKKHGHTLYGFDETPVPAAVVSDTPSTTAENSENEINDSDETCINEENSSRTGFNDANAAHNSERRENRTSVERPASEAASITADNSDIDNIDRAVTYFEDENNLARNDDENATSRTDERADTSSVQRSPSDLPQQPQQPLPESDCVASATAEDSDIESMASYETVLNENVSTKRVSDDVNSTKHKRAKVKSVQGTARDTTSVTTENSDIENKDSVETVLNENNYECVEINDVKDFQNSDKQAASASVQRPTRATVSVVTETENTDSVETVLNDNISAKKVLNDVKTMKNKRAEAKSVQGTSRDTTSVTTENSYIENKDSVETMLNENNYEHLEILDVNDFQNSDKQAASASVQRTARATASVMAETENTESVETVLNDRNSARITLKDINTSQNWDRNVDTGVTSPPIRRNIKNKENFSRNLNRSETNISTTRTSLNSKNNVKNTDSFSENSTDHVQNTDEIQFLEEISRARIWTNSTRSLETSEQAANEVELIDITSEGNTPNSSSITSEGNTQNSSCITSEGNTHNSSSLNSQSVLSALNALNDPNCIPEIINLD